MRYLFLILMMVACTAPTPIDIDSGINVDDDMQEQADAMPDNGPRPPQIIPCESLGVASFYDAIGRVTQRIEHAVAELGAALPDGRIVVCNDVAVPLPWTETTCDGDLRSCTVFTGNGRSPTSCTGMHAQQDEQGGYFVWCGFVQSLDRDGDGMFEQLSDNRYDYVMVL